VSYSNDKGGELMIFSHSFKVPCPVGFMPISRPKEWNEDPDSAYGKPCPEFEIHIDSSISDSLNLFGFITSQILNHYMVKNACLTQLAKCSLNEFRIGIDDFGNGKIQEFCKGFRPNSRDRKDIFLFSAKYLWLFQKNPKFLPEKLE